MPIVFHNLGRESAAEECAVSAVASVEPLCVLLTDDLHRGAERAVHGFDKKVEVITHQAVRMDPYTGVFDGFLDEP